MFFLEQVVQTFTGQKDLYSLRNLQRSTIFLHIVNDSIKNKNSKNVILHIYYTIQLDARYSLVDEHVL
jgi:predicted phosphoadenosine phosphosulfate sulfurtransferase